MSVRFPDSLTMKTAPECSAQTKAGTVGNTSQSPFLLLAILHKTSPVAADMPTSNFVVLLSPSSETRTTQVFPTTSGPWEKEFI